MKYYKNIKLKKRNGNALTFVILAFLIISIFAISILRIFGTNLKQAVYQEDLMEAYYLAYSGAELAYTALLLDSNQYLNQLINDTKPEFVDTITDFPNGQVTIISKKTTRTGFEDWIEIKSTAKLDKNNFIYERTMLFDSKNPDDILWIK